MKIKEKTRQMSAWILRGGRKGAHSNVVVDSPQHGRDTVCVP